VKGKVKRRKHVGGEKRGMVGFLAEEHGIMGGERELGGQRKKRPGEGKSFFTEKKIST